MHASVGLGIPARPLGNQCLRCMKGREICVAAGIFPGIGSKNSSRAGQALASLGEMLLRFRGS